MYGELPMVFAFDWREDFKLAVRENVAANVHSAKSYYFGHIWSQKNIIQNMNFIWENIVQHYKIFMSY